MISSWTFSLSGLALRVCHDWLATSLNMHYGHFPILHYVRTFIHNMNTIWHIQIPFEVTTIKRFLILPQISDIIIITVLNELLESLYMYTNTTTVIVF